MKHLKLFESFHYGNKEKLEQLLSAWNVDPEDLEDLFIWFSDIGYVVQIRVELYGMISTKYRITISIENIKDLYGREIEIEARKIIRGLTKLGLHCLSPARNEANNIMIFVISKG
jgi:hypothetical protein